MFEGLQVVGRFARQILLYVGEAPLRKAGELTGPDVMFRYRTVDIRDLDGERLLESGEVSDNVIAILARLGDQHQAVRRILERIAEQVPAEREMALRQLLALSGLRHLEEFVEREARKMPLLDDILDNKVLGREFKRGMLEGEIVGEARGLREGEMRGLREGEMRGELTILRRQIAKRFGSIPAWAEQRISSRSTTELEDLSERLLDATSLEDLLA